MSLNVLQVIAGLDPAAGGPPACAVATAVSLRREGLVSSIAFPIEKGREDSAAGFVAELRHEQVSVHSFSTPLAFGALGRRWGVSPGLAIWLLRNGSRFDVIHVHSGWTFTTVVGLISAKVHKRAAVLSAHESLTDYDREKSGPVRGPIKRVLRAAYVRLFDLVIVASTLEQQNIGDGRVSRAVVVAHGVRSVHAVRKPADATGFCIGYLGRLHPKKNVALLIDALRALPQDVSLHIAGDGPKSHREMLLSRAGTLGVAERVRWLGFVDDREKSAFFGSINLLAMPSAFECFGMAAAEALSAGVPVVVTPDVGIADVVARYRCGRVVRADSDALAQAIGELRVETGSSDELATNARNAALSEFSLGAHGARVREAYESIRSSKVTTSGDRRRLPARDP